MKWLLPFSFKFATFEEAQKWQQASILCSSINFITSINQSLFFFSFYAYLICIIKYREGQSLFVFIGNRIVIFWKKITQQSKKRRRKESYMSNNNCNRIQFKLLLAKWQSQSHWISKIYLYLLARALGILQFLLQQLLTEIYVFVLSHNFHYMQTTKFQ